MIFWFFITFCAVVSFFLYYRVVDCLAAEATAVRLREEWLLENEARQREWQLQLMVEKETRAEELRLLEEDQRQWLAKQQPAPQYNGVPMQYFPIQLNNFTTLPYTFYFRVGLWTQQACHTT